MMFTVQGILWGIFLFFTSWLWHEVSHGLEGFRQTGTLFRIYIDLKSFQIWMGQGVAVPDGLLFSLAGGIYTSVLFGILSICTTGFTQWTLLGICWMQLIYGCYEGFGRGNLAVVRFSIYTIIISIFLIIWWLL